MAGRNYAKQLNSVIESMLEQYGLPTFKDAWELSREVLGILPVYSFYTSVESDYCNAAFITDELLVDIEGDDKNPPGNLSVQRLSAIGGVQFFEGPVEDVPDSEDAQLVVLTYVAGSEVVDRHWLAYTDEEARNLLRFGKALVESMSRGQSRGV